VQRAPEPVPPRVIAPGVMTLDGERLRFHLSRSRTFPWTVSPHMALAEATVGAVQVESYYFPEHEAAGRAALQTASAALAQFARLFGPYPYATLRIVEGDFLDGMEYCGLFFVGRDYYAVYDGTPQNYLTAIAAHETAHQWWACRVGNEPATEPWLDEALATFSEFLYYEEHHPDSVARWWDFRVYRLQPRGWVDSSVYDFSNVNTYINSVYLRGVLFLRDLRALMGAAALEAALREYATTYDGRIATAGDLWALLERHSPVSLYPLRARYFRA
jgi:aminopeptidase N